jgi:hypothetical protein
MFFSPDETWTCTTYSIALKLGLRLLKLFSDDTIPEIKQLNNCSWICKLELLNYKINCTGTWWGFVCTFLSNHLHHITIRYRVKQYCLMISVIIQNILELVKNAVPLWDRHIWLNLIILHNEFADPHFKSMTFEV